MDTKSIQKGQTLHHPKMRTFRWYKSTYGHETLSPGGGLQPQRKARPATPTLSQATSGFTQQPRKSRQGLQGQPQAIQYKQIYKANQRGVYSFNGQAGPATPSPGQVRCLFMQGQAAPATQSYAKPKPGPWGTQSSQARPARPTTSNALFVHARTGNVCKPKPLKTSKEISE